MFDVNRLQLFITAAVACLVGYAAISMSFLDGPIDPSFGSTKPATIYIAPARTDRNEVNNVQFGFNFHYPKTWSAGPRLAASVVESVGQSADEFCYVSVARHRFESDVYGVPKRLGENMRSLKPSHLEGEFQGAKIKVEKLERSQLGGQEARSFQLKASSPLMGDFGLVGSVTQRNYGAIFLVCRAPLHTFNDPGLQASFAMALQSFRFHGRQR